MNYEKKILTKAALKKAENAVDAAVTLAQAKSWDAVANRLYYACFYAVTAYLECEDINSHTHSSVKSKFHQEFIKSKLLDKKYSKHYNKLFELRLNADYELLINMSEEVIAPLFLDTKSFITEIEKIIASNSDCLDD